jgi:exopolysaccharide production protein ExoZ
MLLSAKALKNQYRGVQALRFLAAFLVVLCHASEAIATRSKVADFAVWPLGGLGVSIFFVISGFVMAVSSEALRERDGGWRTFGLRRLIRIVPLYWLVTGAKILIVLVAAKYVVHSSIDLIQIVGSFFFLPVHNSDGLVRPIVLAGWTLVYEMFFYLIFALALFLKKHPGVYVSIFFSGLVLIGRVFDFPVGSVVEFYTNPILLEFVFGLFIGYFCISERELRVGLAFSLLFAGIAGCWISSHFDESEAMLRYAMWYVPPALLVLSVAQLESRVFNKTPVLIVKYGDASYSIYLFHTFIVPVLAVLAFRLDVGALPAMVAISLLSLLACRFLYVRVEMPLTGRIKALVIRCVSKPQ